MDRKDKIADVILKASEFLVEHGQPETHAALVGYLASQIVERDENIELCESIIDRNEDAA